MKKKLMDILCCPTCKGELELNIEREEEDEVIEGNLVCLKCKATYPIHEGIPDLLPKKEY
ncbi:MAG TPA: Trm112 family protein [Thermoplasmatales archaeon]|nr:Trm112 family protein [Thermoplasmatales archaeon]